MRIQVSGGVGHPGSARGQAVRGFAPPGWPRRVRRPRPARDLREPTAGLSGRLRPPPPRSSPAGGCALPAGPTRTCGRRGCPGPAGDSAQAQQASGGEMALFAQRVPGWLGPVKVRLVLSVAQLTTGVPKRQVPLLHGTRAQPQRGFGPSRTYSFRASVPPAHSGSPGTDAAPSALQLPESQPSHARPDVGSALPLEELDDAPPQSPLQPVSEEEAARIIADPPSPPSSFTLRDYVDHSETLRRLVLLGVDLTRIEKHADAANRLLRLDFEKDIQQVLLFLKDLGLEDDQLGAFLSKNYAIFSEDLEDLKVRVAYLRSKNFSQAEITQMVRNAPFLLSFSVERLDNRLGFFQKELELSVKKTRDLVVRLPRLLTGSLEPVKENMKVYSLELGFKRNEIQQMVIRVPKMLMASKRRLTETFDYVHNEMGVPHHLMVKFPQVFNSRLFKVKERHLFLRYLGRAQYDPTKPSYVSLDKLVSLPDEAFCRDIAKASVQDLERFLKTL